MHCVYLHFLEVTVTFKKSPHHQSSLTPVQGASLNRNLLYQTLFSCPSIKEKSGVVMRDYHTLLIHQFLSFQIDIVGWHDLSNEVHHKEDYRVM